MGFILPFAQDEARAFWQSSVLPAVSAGHRVLLIAVGEGRVVGTVQLECTVLPNQRHRADVSKLLVHPHWRRHGIGRRLMIVLETIARDRARHVLCLDTRSGDPAQTLYQSLGYEIAGSIPDYCRNPFEDRLEPTTLMYKILMG